MRQVEFLYRFIIVHRNKSFPSQSLLKIFGTPAYSKKRQVMADESIF
jgi:hypothetical protein